MSASARSLCPDNGLFLSCPLNISPCLHNRLQPSPSSPAPPCACGSAAGLCAKYVSSSMPGFVNYKPFLADVLAKPRNSVRNTPFEQSIDCAKHSATRHNAYYAPRRMVETNPKIDTSISKPRGLPCITLYLPCHWSKHAVALCLRIGLKLSKALNMSADKRVALKLKRRKSKKPRHAIAFTPGDTQLSNQT